MDVLRSRKRNLDACSDPYDDDMGGNGVAPHGGGIGGDAAKRMRDNDTSDIETRLASLIIRVGDKSTSSLESNLEGLTTVLDADLMTYKSKILEIVLKCVTTMPDKTTVYTTLVGLLNAKNYSIGTEFLEMAVKSLRDLIKDKQWEAARFTFRFIADLVNCHVVTVTSLLTLFDVFAEAMLQSRDDVDPTSPTTVPQTRTDFFAHCILSSLPWVGRHLYERRESDLDRLLGSVESYVECARRRRHGQRMTAYVTALRVFHSDTPQPQEEYLECLWYQIKRLRSDLWIEKHIVRPYHAFERTLSSAMQHNLPQRTSLVPPPHHANTIYPVPRVVFRIFDYTDCPEGPILPGQHSIERYLIEEQIYHTLTTYQMQRKEWLPPVEFVSHLAACLLQISLTLYSAAQLLSYPLKNKVPIEYMIVEVIFGELFRNPVSECAEICYGSILIELCKLQPATVPQVLAQATETLYERIGSMSVSCFDRFVSWFAYHLSNFQFRWSWDDWAADVTGPDAAKAVDSMQTHFVRETLVKCMRLAYHQRIVDMLPPAFAPLYPAKPEPRLRYQSVTGGEGSAVNDDGSFSPHCECVTTTVRYQLGVANL